MKKNVRFPFRYILLSILFIVVCLGFLARIIYLQINAPKAIDSSDLFTRTVTVKAMRGEIYDRNGKKLVSNNYTYNIRLNGNDFPRNNSKINETLLCVFDIADQNTETLFPISNVYSEPCYKDYNLDSTEYKSFMKMMDKFSLPRSTECTDLISFLEKRYGLTDEDNNLIYTEEEATKLMSVRYELERMNFSSLNPFTLYTNISTKVLTAIKESNLNGVEIEKTATRVYNYPGYASHILGRTGKIPANELEYYISKGYPMDAFVGIDGAEKAFEEYLKGTDGILVIVEDKNGNIVDEYYKKEPVSGKDVYLTIDIDLQKIAEDSLGYNISFIKETAENKIKEETLKHTNEQGELDKNADIPQYIGEDVSSGAATLVNPNNGEIYALASNPTFDLTTYVKEYNNLLNTPNNPLFNRALLGTYEPGSTFKISVAAAALENGIINRDTKIFDSGVYKYYKDFQIRTRKLKRNICNTAFLQLFLLRNGKIAYNRKDERLL